LKLNHPEAVAVITDHWGIVKADIGIRDGREIKRTAPRYRQPVGESSFNSTC
jgi:urease gamma subunit